MRGGYFIASPHTRLAIDGVRRVHFAPMKQSIVTLDMEGVLTPEIWIAVAERTGLPELRRTTRDEPDYDKLMRYRLAILAREGITLSKIQDVMGVVLPVVETTT